MKGLGDKMHSFSVRHVPLRLVANGDWDKKMADGGPCPMMGCAMLTLTEAEARHRFVERWLSPQAVSSAGILRCDGRRRRLLKEVKPCGRQVGTVGSIKS